MKPEEARWLLLLLLFTVGFVLVQFSERQTREAVKQLATDVNECLTALEPAR